MRFYQMRKPATLLFLIVIFSFRAAEGFLGGLLGNTLGETLPIVDNVLNAVGISDSGLIFNNQGRPVNPIPAGRTTLTRTTNPDQRLQGAKNIDNRNTLKLSSEAIERRKQLLALRLKLLQDREAAKAKEVNVQPINSGLTETAYPLLNIQLGNSNPTDIQPVGNDQSVVGALIIANGQSLPSNVATNNVQGRPINTDGTKHHRGMNSNIDPNMPGNILFGNNAETMSSNTVGMNNKTTLISKNTFDNFGDAINNNNPGSSGDTAFDNNHPNIGNTVSSDVYENIVSSDTQNVVDSATARPDRGNNPPMSNKEPREIGRVSQHSIESTTTIPSTQVTTSSGRHLERISQTITTPSVQDLQLDSNRDVLSDTTDSNNTTQQGPNNESGVPIFKSGESVPQTTNTTAPANPGSANTSEWIDPELGAGRHAVLEDVNLNDFFSGTDTGNTNDNGPISETDGIRKMNGELMQIPKQSKPDSTVVSKPKRSFLGIASGISRSLKRGH